MKPTPTDPAAPTARTPRGADRVRQLKEAATEMFLSRGYDGVSVDGLIDRVGGSRRNVWGVYGGKEGLFVAAVADLCQEIGAQLAQLPMQGADVRAGLTVYGQGLLRVLLQPRPLAMHRLMVSEGSRFPEQARRLCNDGRDSAARSLACWLAQHQAGGSLCRRVEAAEVAELFIHLVVSGPQLRALLGDLPAGWCDAGLERHVSSVVDLFLHGASAPSTPSPAPSEQRP